MLTLLSKGVPSKLLKFFWLKIFLICHRCQRPRWSTLSCEYLREFSKKFETVLMGYSGAGGKLIHEKNQKRKISWHCPFKDMFWCIFAYFHTTRNIVSEKIFFYCLEWLKTCFYAFAHTFRSPETFFQKRYFLLSEVVKNVFWCICAYFQTTRNFLSKKIFFTIWCG